MPRSLLLSFPFYISLFLSLSLSVGVRREFKNTGFMGFLAIWDAIDNSLFYLFVCVVYVCVCVYLFNFVSICVLLLKGNINREERGGDIGLIITLVPKVLYYCFLICWLNNLWTFIEFCLVGSLSWMSKRFKHCL